MKIGLVDSRGTFVALERVRTPRADAETPGAIMRALATAARDLAARFPTITPRAAGLLVPGVVDERAGVGVFSENLGWRDIPFRDTLSELIGLPVAFGHDVRGAGEAELRLGAAADYRDVAVMTIGTGIACAIFLQGRHHSGSGLAGELGHVRVADHPSCACGAVGCLEAVASAGGIARRFTQLTGAPVDGAREVLRLAQHGYPIASQVWDDAITALARGLSYLVTIVAPDAVIVGGGLAQAGPLLFDPLRLALDKSLTFQRRPVLLPASIGENAGVTGAALRARDLCAGEVLS